MIVAKDFFNRKIEIRHIPTLIDIIIQNDNPEYDQNCKSAAVALGKLGQHAIAPILQAAKKRKLFSANEDVLLSSLKYITDIQAVESLKSILIENRRGQENAAYSLGQIGDTQAIETLISTLKDQSRSSEIHIAVVEALCQFDDPCVVEPLIAVLEQWGGTPFYLEPKQKMFKSLAQIGNRKACAPIIDTIFQEVGIIYNEEDTCWQYLRNLFLDYTQIIHDLLILSTERREDGTAQLEYERLCDSVHPDQLDLIPRPHVFYSCDINNNLNALSLLCENNTQISNNLLHKVKIIKIHILDKSMDRNVIINSFAKLKNIAKEELIRRGNPKYDPTVYLQEESWQLLNNSSVHRVQDRLSDI